MVLLAVFAPAALARTYYVSANGHDRRSGRSPHAAWRTITRVNRAHLKPGDRVLFRGGDSFSDATLVPHASGTASRPIVFGSYGRRDARLHHAVAAIWFSGVKHLLFRDLDLSNDGTNGAVVAGSSGAPSIAITIWRCRVHDTAGVGVLSPNPGDSRWRILEDRIVRTGDSGVIVEGSHDTIAWSAIVRTGSNSAIAWDKHGIYVKGPDVLIADNLISGFQADGVSLRSANARVVRNRIERGRVGVAYFDYSSRVGTSMVLRNDVRDVMTAFYFSTEANATSGQAPVENFVVARNLFELTGNSTAVDVSGGRYSSLSIVNNVIAGRFGVAVVANSPLAGGRYLEGDNVLAGGGTFDWNGDWLKLDAYRTASGQGQRDRVLAASEAG